ncbi:MAG: short-chain dehydrogenase/reductase [Polyangiaceae bacterium]|jgi:NAD(P)-dependent dehydrogenase (short-subunit alcohol dehydrogenase family)|nr:short-chain dehydrogenase/reductase [Polyangiaceae bacterium]
MPENQKLRVVVTGASRGLGFEVCRQLAHLGHHVVLTAREQARAERAAASVGARIEAAELDVTSVESIAAFAKRLGPIDALVNNAGISLKGFDSSVVSGTLAVNFFGALHVTQALLPLVSDGGNVVMVSSGMGELSVYSSALRAHFLDEALDVDGLVALVDDFASAVATGRHTERGWPTSAYRVSKAALNALTRIVAAKSPRLHVNAVCPGWVRTDMGGSSALRSLEEGASGIVWAATLGAGEPTGGFFRDRKRIPW